MDTTLTDTGVAVGTILSDAGLTQPFFWLGEIVPTPRPPAFFVVEPLFATQNRDWGVRSQNQTLQIRCVGTSQGASMDLAQRAAEALDKGLMHVTRIGPVIEEAPQEFDTIVTFTLHHA